MSVVCMTLFLAITSVCGGIGICNALNSSLEKSTSYDATVQTNYGSFTTAEGFRAFLPEPLEDFAEAHDYRILDGLRDSGLAVVATFNDSWITDSVQLDFVFSTEKPLTFSNLDSLSDRPLGEYTASIINPDYPQQAVDLVALSQVNKALEMAGKAPLPVDAGECALIFDADPAAEYVRHLAEKAPILPIGDSDLKVIGAYEESLVTTSFPLNVCTVVVPDGSLPANTTIAYSVLDVLCPSEDAQKSFGEYCMAIQESDNLNSWPISNAMTKSEIYAQSVGLSTVVAYLAIYIGFVLVVACAAILAIQQLSEAGDNAKRYHLLGKLGASRPMLNRALLLQIAIYFLFPLALALAHSICALQVVTDVVSVFGHLDIGFMALVCTAAFLATYGVYFIMTYVSAKRLIRA